MTVPTRANASSGRIAYNIRPGRGSPIHCWRAFGGEARLGCEDSYVQKTRYAVRARGR
jgi:hypothetical protein